MRKAGFVLSISAAVGLVFPLIVSAQTIQGVLVVLRSIISMNLIPLLMTVAIAVFIYGVVKYIVAAGDPEKIKEAKGYIVYGILGLFVLVAFWGLVAAIVNTFGLGPAGSSPITLPPAPFL